MDNLQNISDDKILECLERLSGKENEVTCQIVRYLMEAQERKLYLERGYSSLFDYCTRALRYSEPAAMRRITAARCALAYPEVYELLRDRKLTLSSISAFYGTLTRDNAKEVIAEASGKSKREVERIVSRHNPLKRVSRQRITPVSVTVSDSPADSAGGVETPVQETLIESAPSKEHFHLSFTVPASVMEKLKTAQALSSKGHKLPELFEALLDTFIGSKAPKMAETKTKSQRTRYIPKRTKHEVFARDGYRCAYVGKDGTRCNQTLGLQIDHIVPYAKGGGREAGELRCLCPEHNRLMAEKEFGRGYMHRFYPGSPLFSKELR